MPSVERTALILLAAGRSVRFGESDKLGQNLLGRPLGLHAVETLADLPFLERIAVVGDDRPGLRDRGFRCILNGDPAAGMGGSLRLGVAAAEAGRAEAVLVALADMPRVTAAHARRLFEAADGDASVVASSDGHAPCPPALFGRHYFARLKEASGDAGARDLIRTARLVIAPSDELIDVDTREELDRLRSRLGKVAPTD